MDLFRTGIEHDKALGFKMFVKLLFYSGMPESYTKSVHQMMFAEGDLYCGLLWKQKKVQDHPTP